MVSLHNSINIIDQVNVTLTKYFYQLFWKCNSFHVGFKYKVHSFIPSFYFLNNHTEKKKFLSPLVSSSTCIDSCNHHLMQDTEQKYTLNLKNWLIKALKPTPVIL